MSSRRTELVALVAAVFAISSVPGTPARGIPPQSIARPARFSAANYLPALSDFDGDRRLDQAELHLAGTHHCIRIRFGNSRETHLEFGARPHSSGVLLVRDVNRDDKPDLIWVFPSRSESAVIWLNDGAGRFANAIDRGIEAGVDSLFDDADLAVTGTSGHEQIGLAPARHPSEFAQVRNVESEFLREPMIPGCDLPCDLGVYLSYLRERGPPMSV